MSRTNSKRSVSPPRKSSRSKRAGKQNPQRLATGPQRLQKVLAAAGIASRRQCEQLILEGRVEIDGKAVTTLGTRVDVSSAKIRVDGVPLAAPKLTYYLINKPRGVVSTDRDPAGRPRVVDMVPGEDARLFTVGRLDLESEGLMLLTNDGELAHRLAHPRYGVEKTYQVQVAGVPEKKVLDQLRRGVRLAEAEVAVAALRVKRTQKQSTILEMVLREGKNREIRRILAAVGHKVQRLRRVAIGPLKLGRLPLGAVRPLTRLEIAALQGVATLELPTSPTPKKPRVASRRAGSGRRNR
jgi:23S rRNA pseudouridine2605 synthase